MEIHYQKKWFQEILKKRKKWEEHLWKEGNHGEEAEEERRDEEARLDAREEA
jgi:hypothetical protein